jgi:hypothetical protein
MAKQTPVEHDHRRVHGSGVRACEVIEAQHPPCSFEPPTSFRRTVIEQAKCLCEIDFHALFLPSTADLDRLRHG